MASLWVTAFRLWAVRDLIWRLIPPPADFRDRETGIVKTETERFKMLSKTRSFKTFYHLTWILTFLISLVRLSHADLLDSTTIPKPEEKQSSMILKEEEPASEVPVDFSKPYYHDREEGWFWYIDPQPPKKKEIKKSQPAPQPARIEPKDYKTGWPDFKNADELHAYQKQILDNAVMDPTSEKVKKYLDFQK